MLRVRTLGALDASLEANGSVPSRGHRCNRGAPVDHGTSSRLPTSAAPANAACSPCCWSPGVRWSRSTGWSRISGTVNHPRRRSARCRRTSRICAGPWNRTGHPAHPGRRAGQRTARLRDPTAGRCGGRLALRSPCPPGERDHRSTSDEGPARRGDRPVAGTCLRRVRHRALGGRRGGPVGRTADPRPRALVRGRAARRLGHRRRAGRRGC